MSYFINNIINWENMKANMKEKLSKEVKLSESYYKVDFKYMTHYRAELTHLKSENFTYKEIAHLINKNVEEADIDEKSVGAWYNRNVQPRDCVIKFLEEKLMDRLADNQRAIFNPAQKGLKIIYQ